MTFLTSNAILAIDNISLYYGGVPALVEVSLNIAPGERRGIIGPNGAGKTSLFNVISGWALPDTGVVVLDGREIQNRPVDRIVRSGLARTFQHAQLCWTLSVRQNVELAVRARRLHQNTAQEVERILALIGLVGIAEQPVEDLSYGSQKQTEIAVALATAPRVLLLDEPTAGLSSTETAEMLKVLRGLPEDLTIVLIEHDMDVLFGLAKNVTVLEAGRVIFDGTAAEVQRAECVREAYFGHQASNKELQ